MVRNAVLAHRADEESLLDFVARQMLRLEMEHGDLRVILPVMYPSGKWVAVKIVGGPLTYVVTDDGDGAGEADLMGASKHYARIARKVAQRHSLKFNEHEIFEADATRDQIVGLAIIVAEAARDAVVKTCDWLADQATREFAVSLEDRLVHVFGASAVSLQVEYAGSSAHRWSFDALVKTPGRPLLVSYVATSPVAVASAFVKFDDVRRGDDAPIGVVGCVDINAFEPHQLVLLRRAAHVKQIDTSSDEWRRLAA